MNDPEVGDVWKYNRERAPTDYEILEVNHETGTITLKHLPEGYITSYELSRFRTIDKWELKKRNLPKAGEIWTYTFANGRKEDYEVLSISFNRQREATIHIRRMSKAPYVESVFHGAKWRHHWKLLATQEQAAILKRMKESPELEEDQVIEI